MARQKRRSHKIILLLVAVVASLFIAELTLRIASFSNPYLYTFEDQTGWTLRPNTAGWVRKEGEAYVRINHDGQRDDEDHPKQKPAKTFRIAVLGDSFVEALQVPDEETFLKLLPRDLNGCKQLNGLSVDVLNFGVSNYGTAQELLALRSRVWEYQPDLVVLVFTPANDIRNNSRELERDELRPYFVDHEGKLVADMSFRDSAVHKQKMGRLNQMMYWAINRSRLLQLLNSLKESYQARRGGGAAGSVEAGIDDQSFAAPKDKTWTEAWQITEKLIGEMNAEVKQHGARFMVVSGTFGPQVDPNVSKRVVLANKLGVTDLLYPGQRLVSLGANGGFPVLDLVPPFQIYATQNNTSLHGFGSTINQGHWNQAGHKLVSHLVAEEICKIER
ncbi:MAG TPA: SGNH/GDSL hydrolase family protein [Pyrinomonadaceae bacterium]